MAPLPCRGVGVRLCLPFHSFRVIRYEGAALGSIVPPLDLDTCLSLHSFLPSYLCLAGWQLMMHHRSLTKTGAELNCCHFSQFRSGAQFFFLLVGRSCLLSRNGILLEILSTLYRQGASAERSDCTKSCRSVSVCFWLNSHWVVWVLSYGNAMGSIWRWNDVAAEAQTIEWGRTAKPSVTVPRNYYVYAGSWNINW